MSTLPKLQPFFRVPPKYNNLNTNQNFGQNNMVPFHQNTSGFPPLSPNKQKAAVIFNSEVQNIRELTLRKYENYVSQLRTIDRNFTLAMKKLDQNKTRNLTRINDNVSSMVSEIQQLKNQSVLLNRKLKNIAKLQEQIGTDGITNALKPLQEGFNQFTEEFEKAQKNVDTLFFNNENKVANCVQMYQNISPMTKNVVDLKAALEDLIEDHNNTTDIVNAVREEVQQLLEDQRTRINTGIRERLLNVTNRISILEQSSGKALEQSQKVISDSQTSQFEMRKLFDNEMESSLSNFKAKVENIRTLINDLAHNRFSQLDSVRQRLAASADKISKLKHKNMKQMMNANEKPRISVQSEINELRERIAKIEAQLAEKGIKSKPKESVRMFYSIKEDGSVSYITVTSDGTVIV